MDNLQIVCLCPNKCVLLNLSCVWTCMRNVYTFSELHKEDVSVCFCFVFGVPLDGLRYGNNLIKRRTGKLFISN